MWKKRRNRNSYPVENVVAGDEAPHAIAAYPDRASPKKCQLAMVDELHLQENKLGLDSIEGHRLIDGSAVTIDGYVTAEEIEQSTCGRVHAVPARSFGNNFRCSSFSDDDDLKNSIRDRKRCYSKFKPVSPVKPASPATSAAVTHQNSSDVSTFIQKKSLAQGMMDLALISANTNQLRYILEYRNDHPYFLTSLSLVIGSLFLQLAVGLSLIWNTRFNVRKSKEMREADRVNNLSIVAIFMITLINVFLSTFGGGPQAAVTRAPVPGPISSIPAVAGTDLTVLSSSSAGVTMAIPTTTTVSANNNPMM